MLEKLLQKTLKNLGIEPKGTFNRCEACAISKARQKPVRKATSIRATRAGERLFIDTAGPYHAGINGNRYLVQIVDDYTRMGFSYFIKTKDSIGTGFEQILSQFNVLNKQVKYLRADNARENKKYVKELARKAKIQMEYTSTDTPQFNGVVKRRIETLKQRAMLMMNAANLTRSAQNFLWTEAIRCANTLYNITCNSIREETPYKMFMN